MKPWGRAVLASAALVAVWGPWAPALAQTGTVAVEEENFRAEPGGSILAELLRGTPLSLGETRGRWRQATVEAWIWARSVHEQRSGDLDLLVHADGENLRAAPNGERIGRALGGMRLDRLEAREDWVRVRRTGWIWSPSLQVVEREPPPARSTPAPSEPPPSERPSPEPAPEDAPVVRADTRRQFAPVGEAALVLDAPDGDTLGRLRAGATVEVVAREGEWTRIRMEGWTSSGAMAAGDATGGAVLRDLSRDSLQAFPDRYRGRVVEWAVQFIALQRAERFRSDFMEGEPFMLTRGPGDDGGFVYVAVPQESIERVERLSPLQEIRVLGRIRTARSSLTGAPVLDLLELTAR